MHEHDVDVGGEHREGPRHGLLPAPSTGDDPDVGPTDADEQRLDLATPSGGAATTTRSTEQASARVRTARTSSGVPPTVRSAFGPPGPEPLAAPGSRHQRSRTAGFLVVVGAGVVG